MAGVRLPEFPKGKEFEEYISALLQAGGYYIERNIIDRKGTEVLELDVITTDYSKKLPNIQLLEVKSSEWHFSDLFKVRGWMDYLKLNNAAFIAKGSRDNVDRFEEVAGVLEITPVIIERIEDSETSISELIQRNNLSDIDISTWRYSYWLERIMLRNLTQKKRCHSDQKRFKVLDDYYFKVNSSLFFIVNLVSRIEQLYSTFKKYPLVSAKCAHEMNGEEFDEDHQTIPRDIYENTFFECNYNDIQISTFIEHRARLAILKNAIDYKLYKDSGDLERTIDIVKFKFKGRTFKISILNILPKTFREGLDEIAKCPHFHLYPIFWQWVMWLFGGFILKDKEKQEYAILSEKTGIPIDEIPDAFNSYELLFPMNNGWFMDLPSDSNIRIMQMFPVPFMGVGANYRRLLYTKGGKFNELELSGQYTLSDLIKWNNLLIDVLRQ
jgi:hypothetical protein